MAHQSSQVITGLAALCPPETGVMEQLHARFDSLVLGGQQQDSPSAGQRGSACPSFLSNAFPLTEDLIDTLISGISAIWIARRIRQRLTPKSDPSSQTKAAAENKDVPEPSEEEAQMQIRQAEFTLVTHVLGLLGVVCTRAYEADQRNDGSTLGALLPVASIGTRWARAQYGYLARVDTHARSTAKRTQYPVDNVPHGPYDSHIKTAETLIQTSARFWNSLALWANGLVCSAPVFVLPEDWAMLAFLPLQVRLPANPVPSLPSSPSSKGTVSLSSAWGDVWSETQPYGKEAFRTASSQHSNKASRALDLGAVRAGAIVRDVWAMAHEPVGILCQGAHTLVTLNLRATAQTRAGRKKDRRRLTEDYPAQQRGQPPPSLAQTSGTVGPHSEPKEQDWGDTTLVPHPPSSVSHPRPSIPAVWSSQTGFSVPRMGDETGEGEDEEDIVNLATRAAMSSSTHESSALHRSEQEALGLSYVFPEGMAVSDPWSSRGRTGDRPFSTSSNQPSVGRPGSSMVPSRGSSAASIRSSDTALMAAGLIPGHSRPYTPLYTSPPYQSPAPYGSPWVRSHDPTPAPGKSSGPAMPSMRGVATLEAPSNHPRGREPSSLDPHLRRSPHATTSGLGGHWRSPSTGPLLRPSQGQPGLSRLPTTGGRFARPHAPTSGGGGNYFPPPPSSASSGAQISFPESRWSPDSSRAGSPSDFGVSEWGTLAPLSRASSANAAEGTYHISPNCSVPSASAVRTPRGLQGEPGATNAFPPVEHLRASLKGLIPRTDRASDGIYRVRPLDPASHPFSHIPSSCQHHPAQDCSDSHQANIATVSRHVFHPAEASFSIGQKETDPVPIRHGRTERVSAAGETNDKIRHAISGIPPAGGGVSVASTDSQSGYEDLNAFLRVRAADTVPTVRLSNAQQNWMNAFATSLNQPGNLGSTVPQSQHQAGLGSNALMRSSTSEAVLPSQPADVQPGPRIEWTVPTQTLPLENPPSSSTSQALNDLFTKHSSAHPQMQDWRTSCASLPTTTTNQTFSSQPDFLSGVTQGDGGYCPGGEDTASSIPHSEPPRLPTRPSSLVLWSTDPPPSQERAQPLPHQPRRYRFEPDLGLVPMSPRP